MTLRLPVAALEGELLIIRDARCVLVVRLEDLVQLMKRDRLASILALRRGKAYRGAEAARRRTGDSTALEVMEGG